jgi:prepilin-type N-terminal cleavage/methylation domain-containing protein
MRRDGGFTLIELLVVILIIGILIAMVVPNLRLVRNRARATAVELNMHTVSLAINAFYAENGFYADDFYEDGYGYIFDGGKKNTQLGAFPLNPYSGIQMDPDDFNVDEYDSELDVTNTSKYGPNDEWGYEPGQMRYATYTPLGQYYPTLWGLIGFEEYGRSIRHIDADDNEVIFVVH